VVLYSVLALGSFAAVSVISRGTAATSLDVFRGVAKRQPVLALGFTVLLLAQAGVPLTSGFVAKFGVIRAAVSNESYVLAVVAMVSAVIAAYLYLRIMVSMWLADPGNGEHRVHVSLVSKITLSLSVSVTLIIGLIPPLALDVLTGASDLLK
jgi:NADH-quinone oxidoreductase subunit N